MTTKTSLFDEVFQDERKLKLTTQVFCMRLNVTAGQHML